MAALAPVLVATNRAGSSLLLSLAVGYSHHRRHRFCVVVHSSFTVHTFEGIDLAVYFVYLRFVTSPLMAYLLWQSGRPWIAALALSWPLVGTFLVGWVLMFPEAALAWSESAKAAQIGMIQRRLMSRFGYVRTDAEQAAEL